MLKAGIVSGKIDWGNLGIRVEIGRYFIFIRYCGEDEWSVNEEGWRYG